MIRCDTCNVSFTSNKGLNQHMKGKKILTELMEQCPYLITSVVIAGKHTHTDRACMYIRCPVRPLQTQIL
jgi:hypothetical protein